MNPGPKINRCLISVPSTPALATLPPKELLKRKVPEKWMGVLVMYRDCCCEEIRCPASTPSLAELRNGSTSSSSSPSNSPSNSPAHY